MLAHFVSSLAALLVLSVLAGCGDAREPSAKPPPPVVGGEDRQRLARINQLQSQGRYQEGIALVEERLRQDPAAPIFHYTWGVLLGSAGDHLGAIEKFQQEIARYPTHIASHRSLGIAHTRLGQFEVSLGAFERCLELSPGDHDCSYQLGRNLSSLGRFAEAESHLVAATDRPGADALAELGTLYRRRGQPDQAVQVFRQALGREPYHLATLLNFGQTLIALGRHDEGETLLEVHQRRAKLHDQLEHVERKIQGFGATVGDLLHLARLRTFEKNEAAALDAYRRAVEAAPDHPAAALGYASLLFQADRLEPATKWTIHALTLTPDDPNVHFLLGLLRLRKGLETEAEQAFETSRSKAPWTALTWLNLGLAHAELDRLDQAQEALLTAAGMAEQNASIHYHLARVQARRERATDAIGSLDRCLALDPKIGDAWVLRGLLRFASGDQAGAEADFHAALRAHVLALARTGGGEQIAARFELLPNAKAALDAFRRVAAGAATD